MNSNRYSPIHKGMIRMEWPQPIMIFSIDNELFGCPLKDIQRVLPAEMSKIYSVEVNLPSLYGYCSFDDEFLPLVDFRILFRKITAQQTVETSILVIRLLNQNVGFRCDIVHSVVTPETPLVRLPEPLLMEARDFFSGVFLHRGEIVVVINTHNIFMPGDLDLMKVTAERVRNNIQSMQSPISIDTEELLN